MSARFPLVLELGSPFGRQSLSTFGLWLTRSKISYGSKEWLET